MSDTTRLEHVAIAVENLEAAVELYRALLGGKETGREEVASEGVRVAFFDLGGPRIELLEPTSPDSPVGRFLSSRGPGLHHIALGVDDIEAALERCSTAGMSAVGEAPRTGAGGAKVAFLHPKTTGGLLIELSETVG